jgi:hypothetical protein
MEADDTNELLRQRGMTQGLGTAAELVMKEACQAFSIEDDVLARKLRAIAKELRSPEFVKKHLQGL